MRRISLTLSLILFASASAYPQSKYDVNLFDSQVQMFWNYPLNEDGKLTIVNPGTGKHQELSQQACWETAEFLRARNQQELSNREHGLYGKYQMNDWELKVFTESQLVESLMGQLTVYIAQWGYYCSAWAQEYEKKKIAKARERELITGSRSNTVGSYASSKTPNSGGAGGSLAQTQAAEAQQQPPPVPNSGGAGGSLAETQGAQPPAAPDKGAERESKLMAGSSSSMVEPYTSQRMPNSGGAGGSQLQQAATPNSGGAGGSEPTTWESQPAYSWSAGPEPSVVPNSGGAGGSEQTRMASASPTQQTQQTCDPKSFGDAQLRLLLANPTTRARLASLIAEEPNPSKAKTEQKNPRERRGRAPTDADIARSNSGMSPGTANAIGTIIGVGMGVGLNNIGRRSSSGTSPGGAAATAPRHGTFDGPPR